MTDRRRISTLMFIKDDPIVELLMKEYVILQDKMDKIGGFRFTVKGWALTLITGALVAASATSLAIGPSISIVFLLLFALWRIEYRQVKLSEIFQNRALRIENAIGGRLEDHGLSRVEFATLREIPGIANELRTPFEFRSSKGVRLSSLSKSGPTSRRLMRNRSILVFRRSLLIRRMNQSDLLFYAFLFTAAIIFLYFQRNSSPTTAIHGAGTAHTLRTSESTNYIGVK